MRTSIRLVTLLGILALVAAVPAEAQAPAAKNFVAHLSGGDEVPPRETSAAGQAIFNLSDNETQLSFRLIVSNIENVVASHIHLGVAGVNAPVVAFLAGTFPPAGGHHDGILSEGVITSANLVGPLAGMDLSVLVTALRTGGAYVNVHTNNGIDPTNEGPGDFPGGADLAAGPSE